MPDDFIHFTIKDEAKHVQRFRADSFPMLHPVERVGRDAFLEDKVIFGYALFEQGLKEGVIRYHANHRNQYNLLKLLTMLKILSIMNANKKPNNFVRINVWRNLCNDRFDEQGEAAYNQNNGEWLRYVRYKSVDGGRSGAWCQTCEAGEHIFVF